MSAQVMVKNMEWDIRRLYRRRWCEPYCGPGTTAAGHGKHSTTMPSEGKKEAEQGKESADSRRELWRTKQRCVASTYTIQCIIVHPGVNQTTSHTHEELGSKFLATQDGTYITTLLGVSNKTKNRVWPAASPKKTPCYAWPSGHGIKGRFLWCATPQQAAGKGFFLRDLAYEI